MYKKYPKGIHIKQLIKKLFDFSWKFETVQKCYWNSMFCKDYTRHAENMGKKVHVHIIKKKLTEILYIIFCLNHWDVKGCRCQRLSTYHASVEILRQKAKMKKSFSPHSSALLMSCVSQSEIIITATSLSSQKTISYLSAVDRLLLWLYAEWALNVIWFFYIMTITSFARMSEAYLEIWRRWLTSKIS